jgi:glyoxylase-like metal-dependent hydrolase (beta-lactamase superfamily II)/rhodanese-related sulfurtransferase
MALIFRQLFDPQSSTYTYLLGCSDTREALLIDSVFEQVRRDEALIQELGLKLQLTLETHVHADHVTGAALHRHRCRSRVGVPVLSGAAGADRYVADGETIDCGGQRLTAHSTPGHTGGCMTYVTFDRAMAFTGDCLLIRGTGRTDFQQGSSRAMYRSIQREIFSLPDGCLLYPGHDYRGLTATSVGEEKRFNPRLGGELSENDFAGYMDNLKLAHPKHMAIAVPANLRCGAPESPVQPDGPDWAPLSCTFAGVWEIQPGWLEEHLHDVQVLDVREPDEFTGPLGRIPGAVLIPLGQLSGRLNELAKTAPIVAVCRAGGRSAQATNILRQAGFERVANLPGGMLRWRTEGCSVEGAEG